jgi:hypothetical protein
MPASTNVRVGLKALGRCKQFPAQATKYRRHWLVCLKIPAKWRMLSPVLRLLMTALFTFHTFVNPSQDQVGQL